jgi:hypothetical protein
MRHIFIFIAQLVSRTFDTRQLKTLTNFTIIPFMTQKLLFIVLFCPGPYCFEDEDGQAVTVPSQRYREMIN